MKLKNLACAVLVAVGMASCSAESNDPVVNHVTETVDLEKDFNARSVAYDGNNKNTPNLNDLTPVSASEAEDILTTLRKRTRAVESQSIDSKTGSDGQTFLTINVEQCIDNSHTLTVQLDMISYEDDGSLYYKDHRGFDSSDLYEWDITGFSLSTTGTDGMYKFECTSYLYFKLADGGIKYIQVPVSVSGTYNPQNHDTSFTFSL